MICGIDLSSDPKYLQRVFHLRRHSTSTLPKAPRSFYLHQNVYLRRPRGPNTQDAAYISLFYPFFDIPYTAPLDLSCYPFGCQIRADFRAAVTGTYLVPLSLYQLFLSARVFQQRLATNTYVGTATNNAPSENPSSGADETADPLSITIRAHSNFVEYVPLALIFAAVAELNGGNRRWLNYSLAALTALRVAHVELGLRAKEDGAALGRLVGFLGTHGVMVGLAGYAGWLVKGYWGF